MVAETDVINTALRLIGEDPITSLTDGTKGANVASDIYADLRDDLLRCHPWNFATKRQKLAQSSVTPNSKYDYGYPVPSDFLRIVSAHSNDAGEGALYFNIEQHDNATAVMSSSDQVYIRYIARVEDPNLMAADFRRVLELSLARDMAIPIASSNTLYEQFSRAADKKLAQARSTDAMGGSPERRPRGSWASSRNGRNRPLVSGY